MTKSAWPYGCFDRPRPTAATSYPAQAGWLLAFAEGQVSRMPKLVRVQHKMTTTCQYDKSATDARCAGCKFAST